VGWDLWTAYNDARMNRVAFILGRQPEAAAQRRHPHPKSPCCAVVMRTASSMHVYDHNMRTTRIQTS
jgi:hypothetical protein